MRALFGNPAPRAPGDYPADPVTEVEFPDGVGVDEAFITMTAADGVVANQASVDPTWVSAEDEDLAIRLGEHYGCEVRPYEQDDTTTTDETIARLNQAVAHAQEVSPDED